MPALNAHRAVLLDANLSEEALRFLAENVRVPLFADAVSAAKAARLRPILGRLTAFKPNRMEAELLSGVRIACVEDARRAARMLLKTGLGRVFITLGPDGAFAATEGEEYYLPSLAPRMKNATGAGDAAMAGVVYAALHGFSPEHTVEFAIGCSLCAISSSDTIRADISPALCESYIKEYVR